MTKQKGIVPFTGTLDGINFYIRKGVPVARKAGGGFAGKTVKHDPKMIRVRENYTEFGNTSRVKKIFKDSLFPFFCLQKDEAMNNRMMQLFMKIKDCDPVSERGKRSVGVGLQTVEGRDLLRSFDFTPDSLPFKNDFYDSDLFTYTVTDFDIKMLSFLNGSTHLELRLGVLVFDFTEMKANLFTSEAYTIIKSSPSVDFNLTPTQMPSGNGLQITVLAHRYVQEINGKFYPLKDKMVYGLSVVGIDG